MGKVQIAETGRNFLFVEIVPFKAEPDEAVGKLVGASGEVESGGGGLETNIPQEDFEANPIAAAVAAAEMHSAATRAKACLRSNAAYRAIPMKYAAASGLIQLPSASITPANAKFAHLDFGRTANAIAADIENANGSSENTLRAETSCCTPRRRGARSTRRRFCRRTFGYEKTEARMPADISRLTQPNPPKVPKILRCRRSMFTYPGAKRKLSLALISDGYHSPESIAYFA